MPNPGNPEILLENNDTVVVVPVFSEAPVIASVIDELAQYFPNIYCVDDGSPDGSGEIAAKSGAHVVWHPMNFGQGAALQTGIEAGLENPEIKYFVTFDGDGQHSPLDALEIVNQISKGNFSYCERPVHIVYTDYSKAKGQSLWNSVNILFDLILR